MLQWLLQADGGALLWIQDTLRCAFLDPVLTVYTKLGNAGLLWIVLSLVMLCFPKTRRAGFVSLVAMLLGLLCTNVVLKHLVGRTRPWLVVEGLVPLVAEPDPNSFPSGHTCAAFAAASAWWRTLPWSWRKIAAVAMAAVMAFSRLYVGVHFPTDVVAGMAVGLLCGWMAWLLWKRLAAWRGWQI